MMVPFPPLLIVEFSVIPLPLEPYPLLAVGIKLFQSSSKLFRYFAWDIFCSVWHVKQYGKGFIVHALLGFSTLIFCYKPFTIYYATRFLLFELSTIFLDIHWFLEKVWIIISNVLV